MGVKYERIIERAVALGLPIAEYEFRATKKNPAPDPPFLIYFVRRIRRERMKETRSGRSTVRLNFIQTGNRITIWNGGSNGKSCLILSFTKRQHRFSQKICIKRRMISTSFKKFSRKE